MHSLYVQIWNDFLTMRAMGVSLRGRRAAGEDDRDRACKMSMPQRSRLAWRHVRGARTVALRNSSCFQDGMASALLIVSLVIAVNICWEITQTGTPPMPSYSDNDSWAALPSKRDGADPVPGWCGENRQAEAPVDVFFVHPTAYSFSRDNQPLNDPITNFIVDFLLVQAASAFNGAAAVYSPRYRAASQTVQDLDKDFNWRAAGELPRTERAMELAYGDVEAAFDYFLDHWSGDRPFILASHSQGTFHTKRLLSRLPSRRPAAMRRLVAAYLVGNTIEWQELPIPTCTSPEQLGCAITWNVIQEGGTAGRHWASKVKYGNASKPICVNPLTWSTDGNSGNRSLARGSLPLSATLFLTRLPSRILSARCGADYGVLYVQLYTTWWGFQPIAPEGQMHFYDYALFWADVRSNVQTRVDAYLNRTSPPERCTPCAKSTTCVGLMVWQALVLAVCGYGLFAVLLLICAPCFCLASRQQAGRWPRLAEIVACACCCPCYAARARRTKREAHRLQIEVDMRTTNVICSSSSSSSSNRTEWF